MPEASPNRRAPPGLEALVACLGFFTRLPTPAGAAAMDWSAHAWAAPLAGVVVGAVGAAALLVAAALGLPPLVGAALGVAALVLATGGLHEDGLADLADGFGGGASRERKLEIMRDSRIGAFGALALGLSLILRVAALAALLAHGVGFAAAALLFCGAASRAGVLLPLHWLAPARPSGLGADAARLPAAALAGALGVALAASVALGLAALGVPRALFALALALAAAAGICALARRQIGGQTGDVAGAAQQAAEVAALCGLLIGLGNA